ncbi:hypothetical protein T310_2080 [Rasamsonia emersonii CBS 393.64]|uniref:Uncharacterized protein n=1 Tax=Rasamsonia emersonii (strain ATCC 16479 / CBS 393.64 / IMI 116815) TaxID=1408163 RepID=A0A0F4Z1B8_RASE3|nr:hypothetical protein T310_2080 [Rasamsonia emersonii CBS 393.64]KKA23896.1 hypothetical protein T310_2080 [Rasamsonia emersonii CBS 393.64]
MSKPRTIKDFFKRPSFPLRRDEPVENDSSKAANPEDRAPATDQQSSPLSDPPSSLPSHLASSQSIESGPSLQLKESLLSAVNEAAHHDAGQQSFGNSAGTQRSSSVGGSFNSSQRIIKNGEEIVVDSEGEYTDSIESLESPEELLKKFTKSAPAPPDQKKDSEAKTVDSERTLRPRETSAKNRTDRIFMPEVPKPKYKFTLESLVTDAVDDEETEAGVARAKAALESRQKEGKEAPNETSSGDKSQSKEIREDVLTSAFAEEKDETDLQRLLNAVRRTEAFDQDKSWSFFSDQATTPSPPEFPRDSILPSSREAFLRGWTRRDLPLFFLCIGTKGTLEPASRERAFHSGILEFAFARDLLPDELIIWILHSIPSEPRDDLRHAYCRAIKDIDEVFRSLGAKPAALNLSERIISDSITRRHHQNPSRNPKYLLSVLEVLRDAADLFCNETREHALQILFRLALDTSLMKNSMITRICTSAFNTIQDVALQSQLLKHILPASSWIALFRCRLAVAFFIRDPSPLTEPPDAVLDLRRITHHLRDKRFDVKLYKDKRRGGYDYAELGATTSLLNVIIDLGRITPTFPDKEAENNFNADVDALAERIKRIFSAIEDSGASHLRRTEAKQSLEALHYRIVYSVRSKPPPKKSFFGPAGPEDWSGIGRSGSFMEKFLATKRDRAQGAEDTGSRDDT